MIKYNIINMNGNSFVVKHSLATRELTPEQVSTLHTLYGSNHVIQNTGQMLFVEQIEDAEIVEESPEKIV